ncbi:MAG: DUF402 domain-containing protein [Acidimicrobiia bacterium]
MAERTVTVRYTKWGGGPHWRFDLSFLGADEHGTWLAGLPGCLLQLRDEPPAVRTDTFVALVPVRGAWIAFWNEASRYEIYVDVCDRLVWSPDGAEVATVDLDLDVIRWRPDGTTRLLDEDEFVEHRRTLAYPAELITGAEATAAWLMEAVRSRREPFGVTGPGWLEAVLSRPPR